MARGDYLSAARHGRALLLGQPAIQSYGSGDLSSLLWRGDFETRDLSKFTAFPYNNLKSGVTNRPATPAVVSSPWGSGYVGKFTVLAGDGCSMLSPAMATPKTGETWFYGLTYYIDASFPANAFERWFFDIYNRTRGIRLFALSFLGSNRTLLVDGKSAGSATPAKAERIVLRVDYKATKTLTTAYRSDVLVQTVESNTAFPSGETATVGFGISQSPAITATQQSANTGLVYLDDLRVGTTYAAVA